MRRVILITGVLLTLVVCLGLVNLRRNADAYGIDWKIKKRQPPKEVEITTPTRGEIVQTITAPGTIELVEEADIASEVMGQVIEVAVEKGDHVNAGDLLVKLDDRDARARLESTEARIDRLNAAISIAEADLAKAERDVQGFEKLNEKGFSTRTELEDGRTMVAKMESALEMSRHELKESDAAKLTSLKDLERTEIRAPIDGTVIDLDVELGEVVIAGTTNLPGTVLMTIGDMSRMRVRADVDETDVLLLRREQPSRIYLQADQRDPVGGWVELIAPKGSKELEVVTFETLIRVTSQNHELRPEMTATVEIEVKRTDNAVGVPVQSVVHRRRKDLPDTELFSDWADRLVRTPGEKATDAELQYVKVVFVMIDGVAYARPVETGISDQETIEILKGLESTDQIITGPFRTLDELEDSQPVKLAEKDDKNSSKTKKQAGS